MRKKEKDDKTCKAELTRQEDKTSKIHNHDETYHNLVRGWRDSACLVCSQPV